MSLVLCTIIAAGFALLTFTGRLAETRRVMRARTHERMRRPR